MKEKRTFCVKACVSVKEERTVCVKTCVSGLRGRMAESLDTGIRERSDNDFSKQALY